MVEKTKEDKQRTHSQKKAKPTQPHSIANVPSTIANKVSSINRNVLRNKCVILGDKGVGKTSLIKILEGEEFPKTYAMVF